MSQSPAGLKAWVDSAAFATICRTTLLWRRPSATAVAKPRFCTLLFHALATLLLALCLMNANIAGLLSSTWIIL